jgi:tRNA U34 5-methylaminomethyl-2-thiouridine-forming methyltransferase MnmC
MFDEVEKLSYEGKFYFLGGKMKREVIITKDGSSSMAIPEWNVNYHSHHGAIQESMHVFIDAGLKAFKAFPDKPIRILEIGLGTGLNALLTLKESIESRLQISYAAIEPFPLLKEEFALMNYCELLNVPQLQTEFIRLHTCEWNKPVLFGEQFVFEKLEGDLETIRLNSAYDIIYFDAFAPSVQPELWTESVFNKLFNACLPGGILLTYCSKSSVRHAMKAAGWQVKKIPGPWGKREMVRAHKS